MIAVLKGHTKKISGVVYHPKEVAGFFFSFFFSCHIIPLIHFVKDVAITSSADATIRVWAVGTSSCQQVVKVM